MFKTTEADLGFTKWRGRFDWKKIFVTNRGVWIIEFKGINLRIGKAMLTIFWKKLSFKLKIIIFYFFFHF